MSKKILLILVVLLATVFVFTGCESYDVEPIANGNLYVQSKVEGNGGMAVQQGNYLYFVNGVAGNTADNTFGKVVKGAIMRYTLDNAGKIVSDSLVTVVPKAVYNKSATSGFYVFGEWIYYVSPSTATNSEGTLLTNYIDFFRTKTDGTGTEKICTVDGNSTEYAFSSTALLYVTGNTLYSVKYDTKEVVTIAEEVTSYMIARDTDFDPKATKKDADDYVVYTKALEDIGEFGNEVWVASFDNSFNEKMIGKTSYATDPSYDKVFAISALEYANGTLFYHKYINENGSNVNMGIYSYDVADFINSGATFTANKEKQWTSLSSYNAVYMTDDANKIVVSSSAKLWTIELGKPAVELIPESKTIIAIKGNYVYYCSSSSTVVYRYNMNGLENAVKVTATAPDTGWVQSEMIGDYLYYVNNDYDYVHRIDTKLDTDADGYDMMLGKYNAADQEAIDEANKD